MAYSLNEGNPIPSFSSVDHEGNSFCDRDLFGKISILFFYPKDDTPGCTKEVCDFQQRLPIFSKRNIQVIGVSPDSSQSHQQFREKFNLHLVLLADENHKTCESFDVWREKNFMGRKYWGVERTTFIIDPEGIIRWLERPVKVAGHGKRVTEAIDRLFP